MQKHWGSLRPGIKLALRFVISLFKLKSRRNGQVKQALRPGAEYRFFHVSPGIQQATPATKKRFPGPE